MLVDTKHALKKKLLIFGPDTVPGTETQRYGHYSQITHSAKGEKYVLSCLKYYVIHVFMWICLWPSEQIIEPSIISFSKNGLLLIQMTENLQEKPGSRHSEPRDQNTS